MTEDRRMGTPTRKRKISLKRYGYPKGKPQVTVSTDDRRMETSRKPKSILKRYSKEKDR